MSSPIPFRSSISLAALALSLGLGLPAAAQDETIVPPAIDPDQVEAEPETPPIPQGDSIVVTGFRESLNSAINQKRRETAAIDSIVAEDIGKFPDSNLAESMQRIPGVALARGDGGEGRNISVRGLGPQFSRVRINGMEGTSQTGGSDIFGAGNSGRSFDFNVFPTEIFSALTVRKTPSADVEEGSLGATVDLVAPRPFDTVDDFVLSATARGIYNELVKEIDPRASVLVSKKFGDTFGILASAAYQQRTIREVGYSAVDLLPANVNGYNAFRRDAAGERIPIPGSSPVQYEREVQPFCTPVGWVSPAGGLTISPDPFEQGGRGATATNCSTGNPRTGTIAAYNTIYNLRRDDAPNTPGSGAFFPRIPRYVNSDQEQERIAGTVTLQYQPSDDTDIWLDLLYSRFEVVRRDNYIAGLSFARSITNNGQPMVSVRDIEFDENGSLIYGLFDGVDVRSEGLVDDFVSEFKQINLNFIQRFGDSIEVSGLFGVNESLWDGRKRLQTFIDVIDSDNFSIDFRDGGTVPTIGFGFDVSNPGAFTYAPSLADGTVLGGFSFQGRPQLNDTDNFTGELNVLWEMADILSLKAGAQFRESLFRTTFQRPFSADLVVRPLPAGTTVADITTQITGVDELWGHGAPASWAAVDSERWAEVFDFDSVRFCGVECGGGDTRIQEEVTSAYLMGVFDLTDTFGIGVRGDVGVRYVRTDLLSSGYITVAPPAGQTSPTGVVGQFAFARNDYTDWLPSANIVIEPAEDLLIRLSGAKVLSRPDLGSLAPTSGITATTRTGSVNNPFLDPIRAKTFDAAVEWYFMRGGLLSAAFFYKDIETFVQRITSQIPFNQLGLPDALLDNTNTVPTELFTVSRPVNTEGGPLKGIELYAQIPFTFLSGALSNFGVLANYTHVASEIEYCLASVAGNCTVSTTDDLVGLSPNTASGTIYYEDDVISLRSTVNWRDRFIRGIPASQGSDIQGNSPTLYVDASASFNVTDQIKLILEGQNLTDEQNRLYIDSVRDDTLFETRIGRTYTAGVNFRF